VKRELFGTDGIRGIANRHPMTAEVALGVGRAVAKYFRGKSCRVDNQSIVLIGKDTRRSSYMIEQALAAGVTSAGASALLVGPMPTPGVAFLTSSMRADAGIMVSASHNSYEYNGIKLFGHDGFKLPDEVEAEIESLVYSDALIDELPIGASLGRARRIDDAMGRYIVHVKSAFPLESDLSGMRIVLDSANGAAYKFAPTVFSELGAEVIEIANQPNGTNINDDVGAVHPYRMTEAVKEFRAHLGIALDGDADRVILADENGDIVDGDQLMALLAIELKSKGLLKKNSLVATPMSNMGLEIALRAHGISVAYAGVGDRSVVDLMKKESYNLGGEQSGHIVYLDKSTTGDGVLAALLLMAVVRGSGKPLSELRKVMSLVPQVLKNVRVASKPDLATIAPVKKRIAEVESKLGARGRILVRYSGTEPLCRVMIEGENRDQITDWATELCDLIAKHTG
jgi:phosphoglucosamine mutase